MRAQRRAIFSSTLRALPGRWVRRLLVIGLSATVLSGVYLGYCYGWWLRDNLLAQTLFQCNCPAASEAVRYAPFRLVASGCSDPLVRVSPSGTSLLITERAARPLATVLVDVATRTRTVLPDVTLSTVFVTDTLLLLNRGSIGMFLIDRENPTKPPRPLEVYSFWMSASDRHGEAGTLYVLDDLNKIVFVPSIIDVPGFFIEAGAEGAALQAWAAQPGHTVVFSTAYGRLTPSRPTWDVDGRGIFDRTTQTLRVATGREARDWPLRPWMDPLPFQPIGWLADDRGIIYRYDYTRAFLIDFGFGTPYFGRLGLFDVPQLILALDVPEEVLRATPPP